MALGSTELKKNKHETGCIFHGNSLHFLFFSFSVLLLRTLIYCSQVEEKLRALCCGIERLSRHDKILLHIHAPVLIIFLQLLEIAIGSYLLVLQFYFPCSYFGNKAEVENISTRTHIHGRQDNNKIDLVHTDFQKEKRFLLLVLSWTDTEIIFTKTISMPASADKSLYTSAPTENTNST